MGDRWTWPAYVGVLGGTLVFLAFFVPILLVQSRRYGRLSLARLAVAAALSVYGVVLVAYTLLPLPADPAAWCARYAVDGVQLDPLHFLADIRRETAGLGLEATLRSRAVLQVVFNVLLFVPWGVFVRRYLGHGLGVTVLSGLVASVLIEATQYTGAWGLVGCAYRVADIDDVLTNTLGTLIGAVIGPVVLRRVPTGSELAKDRYRPRPVTVWRRWLGMWIDLFLYLGLGAALDLTYRVALVLAGRPLPADGDLADFALAAVVPGVVVFVLPALWGSGASLGQRAVWLAPEWAQSNDGLPSADPPSAGARPAPLGRRLVRALATGGLFAALSALQAFPDAPASVQEVAGGLSWLVVAIAVVAVPFSRGRRGVSYAVSGAEIVDARTGLARTAAGQAAT